MLKLVLTVALLVAVAAAAPAEPASSQKNATETSLPSGSITSETRSESSTANSSNQLSTPEAPSTPEATGPGSPPIADMGRSIINAPKIIRTCPPGFKWAGYDRGCSQVYT